jgi:transposase
MFFEFDRYSYYLKPGPTDMRCGGDALARVVQDDMGLDVFSRSMFLFCSRDRRVLKVLVWDQSGFAVFSKRLCEGTFRFPATAGEARLLDRTDVERMLRGEDIWRRIPVQTGMRYV